MHTHALHCHRQRFRASHHNATASPRSTSGMRLTFVRLSLGLWSFLANVYVSHGGMMMEETTELYIWSKTSAMSAAAVTCYLLLSSQWSNLCLVFFDFGLKRVVLNKFIFCFAENKRFDWPTSVQEKCLADFSISLSCLHLHFSSIPSCCVWAAFSQRLKALYFFVKLSSAHSDAFGAWVWARWTVVLYREGELLSNVCWLLSFNAF